MSPKQIPSFDIDAYKNFIQTEETDIHSNEKTQNNSTNNNKEFFELHRIEKLLAQINRQSMPPYRQKFHAMALYTAGKQKNTIGLEHYQLQRKTIKFLTAGQIQSWQLQTDNVNGYICYFNDALFRSVDSLQQESFWVKNFPLFNISVSSVFQLDKPCFDRVCNALTQMEQIQMGDIPFKENMLKNMLLAIFWDVFGFYKVNVDADQAMRNSTAEQLTSRFRKLVEQHFFKVRNTSHINQRLVSDYAMQLHVHPNYLNACVKEVTGDNASKIIRERRLFEAKCLLASSSSTISQIAFKLGFSSHSYFSSFFKNQTSLSPSSYRNQYHL